MRSAPYFLFFAFVWILFACTESSAQLEAEQALAALEELHERGLCLDLGDCEIPTNPSDAELRAIVHEAHEDSPGYETIAGLAEDHPAKALAEAVCAVVPAANVEVDGKWAYLSTTDAHFESVLGSEPGPKISGASTGILISVSYLGVNSDSSFGVLTAAHRSTRQDECAGGEDGFVFVFGLTEFDTVERYDSEMQADVTKIRVPVDHTTRADCTLFYLHSPLSDAAFYQVPPDVAQYFNPYGHQTTIADEDEEVFAIGFPMGLPMRMTTGKTDPETGKSARRFFHTSLYAQDGLSGAPVFQDDKLVGMHLNSITIRTPTMTCLACPVPCDVRKMIPDSDVSPEEDCTAGGSWSTEAGYPQLSSFIDLPEVAVANSVVALRTRVQVVNGGVFYRADRSRRISRVDRSVITLARDETVLVYLPPGSRLGVLGRPSVEAEFTWNFVTPESIWKERPMEIQTRAPKRLMITDRSPGRHDLFIEIAED